MTKVINSDDKKNWFKRHKVLTVILAIVAIAVISSAAGGGGDKKDGVSTSTTPSAAPTAKADAKSAATTAKVGTAARDGKFEFTVSAVKCGETSVGSQYLNKTAQGQFCRMTLAIKNIGDKAQSIDANSQYLYNAANQQYKADGTATIYASPDASASTWYNDINPGNTVTGDIIFDIPKDQTAVTAELHDSAFSGGVKVQL
jgi:hypothetical protein